MYKPGELIKIFPEGRIILVVISNEDGLRYIDVEDITLAEEGKVVTKLADKKMMDSWKWHISLGTSRSLSEPFFKSQQKLSL